MSEGSASPAAASWLARSWSLPARVAVAAGLCLAVSLLAYRLLQFPPDTTVEGAYIRIAAAIGNGRPADAFAYLEEEAQVATYTLHDYAKKAAARIHAAYPEARRRRELARYAPLADEPDPPAAWARVAADRGWVVRLRRDLSGVVKTEIQGERATITTARGTRYSFRRRPNGIWGLTMFTAELDAYARKLARDWDLVQKAAADYQRAR